MRADDSSHNLAEPFILKENERLGFVFPVHGWRVPKLVREFIGKMKIQRVSSDASVGNKAKADDCLKNRPFTYCVCTAGDSIGLTIENLNEVISQNPSLQALGITEVSSSYSLIMPESYIGLPLWMWIRRSVKSGRRRMRHRNLP